MSELIEKTWIVRFKPPETSIQPVIAATAGIDGDFVVFVRGDGSRAALFAMEVVENWSVEIHSSTTPKV
jgi:hypothetical protein